MNRKKNISIFDYTDYRQFMVAFYECKKKEDPKFSHRSFAAKAGINSSGLYTDIINKRTNIKVDVLFKLSKAFEFNKRETDYFRNLVGFNQAKVLSERNYFFEKMISKLHGTSIVLESDKLEYYSKWYYVAIRELCSYQKIKEKDYELTASLLNPKIKPAEAEKTIKTLVRLNLLAKNNDGYLKPVDNTLSTGLADQSLHISNFQKSMAELAVTATNRATANQRNISTLTFSTNETTYTRLTEELTAFRKKLIGIIEEGEKADRIYQINLQLFPLTYIP
jgi:uncharacterized protein (TIGR02147 family)